MKSVVLRAVWLSFQQLELFSSVRVILNKFSVDANRTKKGTMKLPTKLGIGCLFALVFIIAFGFIGFPKLLTGKIKQMVNLGPDTEIRKMFVNVPFGIDFNIYIFNVTNPMEIQSGAKPRVQEVGPFCYSEWIKKINVDDEEGDDTMSYNPVFTFYKRKGPGCVSGQEVVTIPHPLILGMVNAVVRQKPGALSLVNKAIKSIYQNPTSIFLTASADDILFDGVPINCGVKDFAGKAICSQLKEADSLRHIDDDTLAFALMAPKNGTPGKRFQVLRGTTNFHYVGKILNYDGSPVITTWPNEECNKIDGTDGTIFPPFLTKEEGIASFSPELCRSLKARYVKNTRYNGVPVRLYTADLGDASQNEDEKCFCYTPDTCLKKGLMDLYKCVGVPIYVSMPHFWNCHKSYLKGVDGLKPNKTAHEITILFESMTGGPVAAGRRLQFNMPLWPNEKVDLFKNFTDTVLPMFWVEESIKLNRTMTKPLKRLFTVKRIMNKLKWLVLLSSIGGMGVAFYLHLRGEGKAGVTPIEKVKNEEKGISIVNSNSVNGHDNPAMTTDESDKF